MDFEIKITGKTDPVLGKYNDVQDFVKFLQHECDRFPISYEMKVELINPGLVELKDPAHVLNDLVDKACYIEDGVAHCHNIGNVFTMVQDGFPVELNDNGAFVLYDSVFNEMPKGWDDVRAYRDYEEDQLTPWLRSMGFTNITWRMGEADSFGPLSRHATMKRGQLRFEFIYG